MDEIVVQEHTYVLQKQIGVGFGIAISGGRDNPGVQSGDTSIIISDVVKQGPAYDKLKVNDVVLRVNGKPMYNMEHRQAVKELKNSGQQVELTIRRKVMIRVATPPPGPVHRSRSRDIDSSHRHRSRSRDPDRGRYRSRSRDLDDSRRRYRSRSRDIDSPRRRRRSHRYSRSRSRTPSRRGRSYSRSPSNSRRSYSPGSSPSYRRRRSRSRTRSRTPPRRRSRSRSSFSGSSRSVTPPPTRSVGKHKSVEDLRRDLSPLSPDPEPPSPDQDMMVFPVKMQKPKTVVLKKTRWNNSYGLKLGTRIYIQDIQPNSLADKSSDIEAGNTVLMINGRNVDNKTVQEAIQIIGLSKDKVTMLVKKEDGGTVSLPAERFNAPARNRKESESEDESNHSHHSDRSSFSEESEKAEEAPVVESVPKVAPKAEKKHVGGIRVLPSGSSALPARAPSSTSSQSTPEPAPRSKQEDSREYAFPPGPEEDDGPVLPPTARQITFVKGKNVGIRLAGGNDVGIFVASVQEGSAAAKQGLKMGDQILSVNDVNFRNIIREEAVLTLMGLPTGDEVRIIAQPQPEVYKKILEHGTGDSFYIRTHFKYEKSGQHEMSFKRGSAFRISDTLYQGMVGYWLAVRIGRNNMEVERGVIPNSSRAEQLKMVQDKKIAQMRDRGNRGISRRLIKNQKSEAPPSSSSSSMFPAYERVVLREAGFKRPAVIFGPLADISRERLAGDHNTFYEIARNEGMVSGQKSNRKGVIRLNTIKDIIEKDKHAILDITPAAVEKLNYAQLYPIVVFLEAQSKAAVKELRHKLSATDEEKKKKAGKLYNRALKLQRGYSHVFTDTIKLTTGSDDWYRKLHSTIKDQQSMPVWVSEDKLGGGGEGADEGMTVPGDDDRLSYVSAPGSDYSVTTAGSDILNTSRISDDDEEVDTRRTSHHKPPSSTSSEEEAGKKFGDDDFDDALDSDEEPPVDKPVPPAAIVAEPEPMPEAPPREKKMHSQPPPQSSSSSSSSEEEEPPIPTITPKLPTGGRVTSKVEPPRGKEIPDGRFDPSTFLKNHIRGLKQVSRDEETSPPPAHEPPASVTKATPSYAPPPATSESSERPVAPDSSVSYMSATPFRPVNRPEPQQPVYAQVNKNRSAPTQQPPPQDRRESMRDYANEIDNFVSNDPYKRGGNTRPQNERAPVREEPSRYQPPAREEPSRYQPPAREEPSRYQPPAREEPSRYQPPAREEPSRYQPPAREEPSRYQPPAREEPSRYQPQKTYSKPTSTYDRFAGSSQAKTDPKPYQPPSANKSQYQRPPVTNGVPQKSKFVQEKYKDYMNQIKPTTAGSYNNPRPYSKPTPKFNNGIGSKENMYDSGVDTYDNAKPKKDPVPVSPSTIDEDDPQVVATARGVFDSNGGVLSSVETGVSIMIPNGAIRPGVRQEIYFKVCRDNTALPPLDKNKGETLLSPLVMCGPHGLQFEHPVELRLPHCASMTSDGWSFALKTSDPGEPSQWQNVNVPNESNNYDVGSNSVSVLIDHF